MEPPDLEEAPDLEIARMRDVDPIAVRSECRPRRVERLRSDEIAELRHRDASSARAAAVISESIGIPSHL